MIYRLEGPRKCTKGCLISTVERVGLPSAFLGAPRQDNCNMTGDRFDLDVPGTEQLVDGECLPSDSPPLLLFLHMQHTRHLFVEDYLVDPLFSRPQSAGGPCEWDKRHCPHSTANQCWR